MKTSHMPEQKGGSVQPYVQAAAPAGVGKERPILFQGAMVRALLADAKTQTRRLVKPQPHSEAQVGGPYGGGPYGQIGDRLWVREAWRVAMRYDGTPPRELPKEHVTVMYEAGGHACNDSDGWKQHDESIAPAWRGKLRPGMFMPRWACRTVLEVTGVRVERLKAISRGDAMDEGCPFPNMAQGDDPRQWYAELWNSINGAGSWDANPWVWVVEFQKV